MPRSSTLLRLVCWDTRLKLIITRDIAEIASADFGSHVPAVEGRRGELQTPAVEQHIGHGRHNVPLQAQLGEPVEAEGHRGWRMSVSRNRK